MPDYDYYNNPAFQRLHGYVPEPPRPYPWQPMQPLFGGGPEPRGPSFLGLDPNKGGVLGGLAQSFGPMIAEALRIPLGGHAFQFGGDMNVVSTEIARKYVSNLQLARTKGAEADMPQIDEMLRGLARVIGHESNETYTEGPHKGQLKFSPDVEASIRRMTQDVGPGMLPILASMFPDTIDKAFPRGSMAVAAQSFVRTGRYIRDPATGGTISDDPEYGMRIAGGLLERGLRSTAGLGAGRIGQTFEALFAEGLIGSGTDLQRQVEKGELTGGKAKEIQTERIKDQLGKYSHVIAAINDIFAESGHANAPMAELMKGLQNLTQGGVGVYDPGQLTRVTRTTHAATQPGGIGMSIEQLGALSQSIGGTLGRHGVSEALAGPLAPYVGALGAEYAARGFTTPSPEGMSQSNFTMMTGQRMAAGAGSEAMNTVGAIWALARAGKDTGIDETPFGEVATGLHRGEAAIKLKDGSTFDTRTARPEDYQRLAQSSGMNYNDFLLQLRQQATNKAQIALDDRAVTKLVPELQRFQAGIAVERVGRQLLSQIAPGHEEELLKLWRSESVKDGVTSDVDVGSDVAKRFRELHPELKVTDEQQRQMAQRLGSTFGLFGQMGGTGSGFTLARSVDPEIQEAANQRMVDARKQAWRMAQLESLMRGGSIRNLAEGLVEIGYGDRLKELIGGGVFANLAARGLGLTTAADVDRLMAEHGNRMWAQLRPEERVAIEEAAAEKERIQKEDELDFENRKALESQINPEIGLPGHESEERMRPRNEKDARLDAILKRDPRKGIDVENAPDAWWMGGTRSPGGATPTDADVDRLGIDSEMAQAEKIRRQREESEFLMRPPLDDTARSAAFDKRLAEEDPRHRALNKLGFDFNTKKRPEEYTDRELDAAIRKARESEDTRRKSTWESEKMHKSEERKKEELELPGKLRIAASDLSYFADTHEGTLTGLMSGAAASNLGARAEQLSKNRETGKSGSSSSSGPITITVTGPITVDTGKGEVKITGAATMTGGGAINLPEAPLPR